MQHIINTSDLSRETIIQLIDRAQHFIDYPDEIPSYPTHSCGFLFFENSTRTQHSFYLAASRLNMIPLVADIKKTSLSKQESVADMLMTWSALGIHSVVIRHSNDHFCQMLLTQVQPDTKISIINAGNGVASHPSQALLDIMTIYQAKGNWNNLKVVIMGDYKHSRVARSLVCALEKLGKATCHWIGPHQWQPENNASITIHQDMNTALSNADVVVCLRIQQERLLQSSATHNYLSQWGLTQERLQLAKPDAMVMHPGPINRGVEISSEIADGPQAHILKQVNNGLYMRMAILSTINDNH